MAVSSFELTLIMCLLFRNERTTALTASIVELAVCERALWTYTCWQLENASLTVRFSWHRVYLHASRQAIAATTGHGAMQTLKLVKDRLVEYYRL